jgi:hypothetical protein
MGIFFIALYFGIYGLYSLWSYFSTNRIPTSPGEVLNSQVLVAALHAVVGAGLLRTKMWSRHAALGISFFNLGKTLFIAITQPQTLILGAYFISMILAFLGISFSQMLLLIVIGLLTTIIGSLFIIFILMGRKNVAYFYGDPSFENYAFKDRLREARDFLIPVWIFIFWVLSSFQSYVPTSFYNQKSVKDFKAFTKSIEETPEFQAEVARKKTELENSYTLALQFSNDGKKLYLQSATSDRFHKPQNYQFDLVTYKLAPLTLPVNYDINQISPDKNFILHKDRDKILEISTGKEIKSHNSLGVISQSQSSGYTSFGFGPTPGTHFLYSIPQKSLLLKEIETNKELKTIPIDVTNATHLTFKWFPSRQKGLLREGIVNNTWLVDLTESSIKHLNLPSLLSDIIITDNDETAFISLRASQYINDKKSFILDLKTGESKLIEVYGLPIAFSRKNNSLIYNSGTQIKMLMLQEPYNETILSPTVPLNTIWNIKTDEIYLRAPSGQLTRKDLSTMLSQNIGKTDLTSTKGSIAFSPSGQLIAMSSGRHVQIFWRSEIDKPNPRSLHFEIPKLQDEK